MAASDSGLGDQSSSRFAGLQLVWPTLIGGIRAPNFCIADRSLCCWYLQCFWRNDGHREMEVIECIFFREHSVFADRTGASFSADGRCSADFDRVAGKDPAAQLAFPMAASYE